MTASTSGEPVTQMNTMVEARATSAAVSAAAAPRPTRSSSGARFRCAVAVSGYPFSTMFFAMP